MGFYNSPRIILDDLVLNLDAGNTKSYAGNVPTPVGTNYGYMGGGGPGTSGSFVDRIDYDNDTALASVKGPLNAAVSHSASTGNISYGYWCGGQAPGTSSAVDRVDYSNDTPTATAKGPLSVVRKWAGATGSSSYGYIGGGNTGSDVSSVDRIDYSSDTSTAAPKGPLTVARRWASATGNTSYGWFAGGEPAPAPAFEYSIVDRIDYSNDTATASPKGNLDRVAYGTGATGNADYGYIGGGNDNTEKSFVSRIDYSNDTSTAVAKGPLTSAKKYPAGTGSTTHGYFAGGKGVPARSTIDRVDYSNDTPTATAKGPLSDARTNLSGASPRANALATTSGMQTRYLSSSLGTDYGYWAGGSAPGVGGPYSTTNRIDYSSDTTDMTTKGPLTSARSSASGTGDTSYGYAVGGGWPIGSLVDRLDYSSDTTTMASKGPLETNTGGMGPVTNNTYGYFASGRAPSEGAGWTTEIQRIEYANDTSASVVKGNIAWPAGGQGIGGVGNMDYGYFGGGRIYPAPGYASITFVGRIDYSNDTQTAPAKGPLSQTRGFLGATGNASYGYFGGGQDQSGDSYLSTIDRVDYSNDTATAVAKGPLVDGKHYINATGNTSYGYWAGGYGNTSKSQRLDYSNDTATAVAKGNLTLQTTNSSSFSSRECNLPTSSTSYPWYDTSVRVMMEIIVVVVPASVVQVVDHSHLMEAVITYPVMIKQIYN